MSRELYIKFKDGMWVLTRNIEYKKVEGKRGDKLDGLTLTHFLARLLFSMKDINNGAYAIAIHDLCCKNKHLYGREESTQYLVELWVEGGLKLWKAFLVKHAVNLFQKFKGGWKS